MKTQTVWLARGDSPRYVVFSKKPTRDNFFTCGNNTWVDDAVSLNKSLGSVALELPQNIELEPGETVEVELCFVGEPQQIVKNETNGTPMENDEHI